MTDDLPKEACAWVPGTMLLTMQRVLLSLQMYMAESYHATNRRPTDPHITGYKVLDDRGGSGHFQVRVEGLTAVQLRRIVGSDVDVSMEHV